MPVKAKNILNFHIYEIIYNYIYLSIFDHFYLFFQLSLTLNLFLSELSFLGPWLGYLKSQ